MKKVISIIIPTYNMEKYLDKCLSSLLVNGMERVEIIVVNDGSKDNTAVLLEEYNKNFPDKIIVIHQENKGVSEARNAGLNIAKGDYITFLDIDDYIKNEMYFKLMSKAIDEEFDIVACDTLAIYPDYEKKIVSSIEDNQKIEKLLIDAYSVLWNKVYKKEIIDDFRTGNFFEAGKDISDLVVGIFDFFVCKRDICIFVIFSLNT